MAMTSSWRAPARRHRTPAVPPYRVQALRPDEFPEAQAVPASHELRTPSYLTFTLLQYMFIAFPIVMGIDKFTNLLTYWPDYLAPWIVAASPVSAQGFLHIVGVIEIGAGVFMAFKPRYTSWIISAWLGLIIVNLLTYPGFYDIVLRDAVLLLAVIALARLGKVYDPRWEHTFAEHSRHHGASAERR